MDDKQYPWTNKSLPWLYRIAGAIGLLGGSFGIYRSITRDEGLGDTIYVGVSFALGAAFVFFVPAILSIVILETAASYARDKKSPVMQGIAFTAMLFVLLLLVDLVFLGGELISTPILWPVIDAFVNQ